MKHKISLHKWDISKLKSPLNFLSAMSLPRTFKDLNSCLPSFSIETKSWQKRQSFWDSNNLVDFNNVNKEFLPRKSSQKFLQKNPKKFLILTISNSLQSHLEVENPFWARLLSRFCEKTDLYILYIHIRYTYKIKFQTPYAHHWLK